MMGKYLKTHIKKQRGILITRLMSRDGMNCMKCKKPLSRKIVDPNDYGYITIDHIIPQSRGGQDIIQNKQLMHRKCNQDKGNDYK